MFAGFQGPDKNSRHKANEKSVTERDVDVLKG